MVTLSQDDERRLAGADGKPSQFAMEVMVRVAEASGASGFTDASMAHIGSCFYTGQVGVDFAEFLLAGGGHVAVPTMTNVSLIDALHPELRPERSDPEVVRGAMRLMEIYEALGCDVVWTCAPYQQNIRPGLGDQIVASESNAVAFYNSVCGARTNKYGDFVDICAAITGRVPTSGLHTDEGRRGRVLFRISNVSPDLMKEDVFPQVLGIVIGRGSGKCVPVIEGLPDVITEDQFKAIGSSAATAGSVALFHVVGHTPEAATLDEAFRGGSAETTVEVTPDVLFDACSLLNGTCTQRLGAVCLGTPHFSVAEFAQLVALIDGRRVHPDVNMFVSTSRHVASQVEREGWQSVLDESGVQIVLDTCTYYTPIVDGISGTVMTNSAKWAYYAPGMLGLDVAFASMRECVDSAVRGEVTRDPQLWSGDLWGANTR